MVDALWRSYKKVVFWPAALHLTHWNLVINRLLKGEWALITPDNAGGCNMLESVNKQQRKIFRTFLKQHQMPELAFYGGDQLKHHKELTFALNINESQALLIGKKFKQRAIYTLVDGKLKLLDCHDSKWEELGHISEFIVKPDKY